MIAPVSAPQVPDVRAMPLQNAVAILGKSSDSIPSALAIARTTLSAQKRPDANSSWADLRTSEKAVISKMGSDDESYHGNDAIPQFAEQPCAFAACVRPLNTCPRSSTNTRSLHPATSDRPMVCSCS